MQPQDATLAHEAQYQDFTENAGTANIVRLQPVVDPRCQYVQGPQYVSLEPVDLHTDAQQLDIVPPVMEDSWQPWPPDVTLPTLVWASPNETEGTIFYCLKITCSQCCAVQTVPTYARIPTEEELQQEMAALAGTSNNELQDYNGSETDRLVADEDVGQHDQTPGLNEGYIFTDLNPNAPEFFRSQVPETLNPEAPPFISSEVSRVEIKQKSPETTNHCMPTQNPCVQNSRQNDLEASSVEIKQKSPETTNMPTQNPCVQNSRQNDPEASSLEIKQKSPETTNHYMPTQNPCVQNSRQNERPNLNQRLRQNGRPRNRTRPPNFRATRGGKYNRKQQRHQSQSNSVSPENAVLVQLFQDTTVQMLDRHGVPSSLAPVPLAFCWAPEGAALHCMSTCAGCLPSQVDRSDYT